MNTPVIDYYLAPQSPWTFLGHARFAALAQAAGAVVRVKPVDLARVFSLSGGLPLGQRAPQRQSYRLIELRRFSALLGIPLNLAPRHFPVAGDAGARLIIAGEAAHGAGVALALTHALGRAVWQEERDIAAPATLIDLADDLGLDGARLFAESEGDAVTAAYLRHTEDALRDEVFGAPTYVLAGERFWGQDRLDLLERALAGPAR
jgi:2-hydroxychromene-2-carboxylate isomerase